MKRVVVVVAVLLMGSGLLVKAQSVQTVSFTTGPHPGGNQGAAGGQLVLYNGQPCPAGVQGYFSPYQAAFYDDPSVAAAQGSLYGCDSFLLEGIGMGYGPVIPLVTALSDGSTHSQTFTMALDANNIHWSGSFTEYYRKLTKLSCGRRCVYITVFEPTQGSGSLSSAQ